MIKRYLPVVGRLYRQRDAARAELQDSISEISRLNEESKRQQAAYSEEIDRQQAKINALSEELRAKQDIKRLYALSGVLLEIPVNIISDKFHSDLLNGTYEDKELSPIRQNINPSDVVLELGAAVGFISTWVAKLLKTGRVVTYEANPNMIPVAANNHKLNNVNVELNHALVTSLPEKDTMEFYVDRTFFWDSGIVPRAHDNGSVREKIAVKTRCLAHILKEVDPTLLIVDIEGGEVGLFDRVESLGRLRHIFFELHAFIGPFEIHKIFKRLQELGFSYNEPYSNGYVATFTADIAL